jgi:hypothetical protein
MGPVMDGCAFDAETHTYTIDGRPVPSVTEVMADVIPGWHAGEWYLQRGQAVHACAALIAQGLEFDHDPRIAGQVAACRKFFRDTEPWIDLCEYRLFSKIHQYGGTVDLVVSSMNGISLGGRRPQGLIIDYKAALTDAVPIQLAAYAALVAENFSQLQNIRYGIGVELRDNGTYKWSDVYDLRRHKHEWLSILTAYRVRRRVGIDTVQEPGKEFADV